MSRFWGRVRGLFGTRRRQVAAVVVGLLLAEAAFVGSIYWRERSKLKREMFGWFIRSGGASDAGGRDDRIYEFRAEGVRRPPARPAGDARLADHEGVIGVVAGGHARAYRLKAMKDRDRHVVNDVVSGVPVSVTYCDLDDCVRAFTAPEGEAPLDVSTVGLKKGRMVINVGGVDVFQDSGQPVDGGGAGAKVPYPSLPTVRTSWKLWREAHPQTDVYLGPTGGGTR
jgi:hypothetical protein